MQEISCIEFCILQLYWIHWLALIVSGGIFRIFFLGFSLYRTMSSTDSDSFTSFLTWIPFISFSLIAVARTSKTMLKNSGEWALLFFSFQREDTFCFSPLRVVFALGLSHCCSVVKLCPTLWFLLCWDMFPLCPLSGEFFFFF